VAYATWDQVTATDSSRILKGQFGLVLFRDYGGVATETATYNPFDPTSGHLSTTLLTTDGWVEAGFLDENGVQHSPKQTTVDVQGWQSRQILRSDLTLDTEDFMVTLIEATQLSDALYFQTPLSAMQNMGEEGYQVTKLVTPVLLPRQALIIGVDNSSGNSEYFAQLYPLVRMVKADKYDWNNKNPINTALNFTAYVDPHSGYSMRRFREGPAWRAAGGVTGVPGTPVAAAVTGSKATLTFTPPTSLNTPFTYTVKQTTGSTTTTVATSNVIVTSSSPTSVVLTVSGLTTSSAYTFTVAATGDNGSTSAYSAASNSITAIA
jgi:hypothetical protein